MAARGVGDQFVFIALRLLALETAVAAVLFGSAGRIDLPWFWSIIGIHTVLLSFGLWRIDPELRKERFKPLPGGKDRLLRLIAMPLFLIDLAVAGLDVGRFHWSGNVPIWVHAIGLSSYTCGLALAIWAMIENCFFSPVVRIQEERGHHLVSTGPYRLVRHPGYIGMILAITFGALALGSYWAMLPLLVYVALIIRRTAIEDEFLIENLQGYAEFVEKVRYRLVPGFW